MAKTTRFSHPDVKEEMLDKIDDIIMANRNKPGSLITVLRLCQNVVGYLPIELLDFIAQELNLPGSDVVGVATFYSLFSLKPKGRHTIRVCLGTACYVKGIKETIDRIESKYQLQEGQTTEDRRFTLEAVRCLGACGLAPVMVVGQDTYGSISADKIEKVLDKYQ